MAGQNSMPKRKYEYLEQLPIEKLEELLNMSVNLSSDEEDEEYVDAIIQTIIRKEKERPTDQLIDVDASWKEFQERFNTPEGEGLSLYPDEENEIPPAKEQKRPRGRGLNWRGLSVAAIILLLSLVIVPPAMGYANIFDMVGRWSDEVFRFAPEGVASQSPEDEKLGERGYLSLQEALDDYGITEALAPTWVPEGFELYEAEAIPFPDIGKTEFHELYQDGDKTISTYIVQRNVPTTRDYEKDIDAVKMYEAGDVEHYIFDNNGRIAVTWYVGDFECSIRADISVEEVERMIDSIYER